MLFIIDIYAREKEREREREIERLRELLVSFYNKYNKNITKIKYYISARNFFVHFCNNWLVHNYLQCKM